LRTIIDNVSKVIHRLENWCTHQEEIELKIIGRNQEF
jgi:hypothetical protein